MSSIPDEIWSRIIEIGTAKKILSYRDVCCISMSCRLFNRLSNDDYIWSILFSLDFPSPKSLSLSTNPSLKSIYKSRRTGVRFETERALKVAAYEHAVLNIESQVAIYSKNLEKLQLQLVEEKEKMKALISELTNLEKEDQKCKLKAGKEGLASFKYHPLHDYQSGRGIDGRNLKRKKRGS